MTGCDVCLASQLTYSDFDRTVIGVDETRGRFGDVRVDRCRSCEAVWLHYYVEYHYRDSGRWFRGIIEAETAKAVTPETAIAVLEQLPWHMRGGMYFGGKGARSTITPLPVDA